MTAIDNENPTPEEAEETQHAGSGIAGTESISPEPEATEEAPVDSAEENLEEEAPEENKPVSSTKNPFSGWQWTEFRLVVALALIVVGLLTFVDHHIQTNKGTVVPVNGYSNSGQCFTQYWHVPDRFIIEGDSFEQHVAKARAEGAADFRGSETCKIQIVHPK